MARMAKSFASELGTGENLYDWDRSSGVCAAQTYSPSAGRWAGGVVSHSHSSLTGTRILEHSAKVITREYRNTPVASPMANWLCSRSKTVAYPNTGMRHATMVAATFRQPNPLMIMYTAKTASSGSATDR